MTRPKRIQNPPRKCIFCGEGPISREHIWAEWMRGYLPTGEQSQSLLRTDKDSNTTTLNPGQLTQKGDARSRKLKVVCKACNSGWMSGIQTITKPILLPLLIGERSSVSASK